MTKSAAEFINSAFRKTISNRTAHYSDKKPFVQTSYCRRSNCQYHRFACFIGNVIKLYGTNIPKKIFTTNSNRNYSFILMTFLNGPQCHLLSSSVMRFLVYKILSSIIFKEISQFFGSLRHKYSLTDRNKIRQNERRTS